MELTALPQVQRALEYTLSGKLVVPESNIGQFTKENWGDYYDVEGLLHRRATLFIGTMEEMPDEIWKSIIDGAKACDMDKDSEPCSRLSPSAVTVEVPPKRVFFDPSWGFGQPATVPDASSGAA